MITATTPAPDDENAADRLRATDGMIVTPRLARVSE